MSRKQKKLLIRILISAAGLLLLNLLPVDGIIRLAGFLLIYVVIGYDILRKAFLGIIHGRVFNENFLMAIATIGAFVLAGLEKSGDYNEAVAVMLFYQVGELFQSYAVGKSRRNISQLMDLRPDCANVERDGRLEQVDPESVNPGDIIVVQPGEKVPIDGVIIEGSSAVNTSALTGESVPRETAAGDEILSGMINMTGVLKVRTTKPFGESTVSKILEMVEDAGSRKARSEQFITRFARVYTPVVCISAVLLAVVPPLIRTGFLGEPANWQVWIYRALTFLIISCPCALVVSIPLSFFAGIGGAGKEGILVKGSDYLEKLSRTKVMVFDKTGTLTRGVFEVDAVHRGESGHPQESGRNKEPDEASRKGQEPDNQKLIEYAALAECSSSHPISHSLQAAYGREIDRSRVSGIEEISGRGILATVDGKRIAAGNRQLMDSLGVVSRDCHLTGTIVHVAIDGEYAGHIVISDVVKPTSGQAIKALKENGVEKTVMLTGDSKKTAEKIAADLGVDEVHSDLLPADKVDMLEELLKQQSAQRGTLAFAGDGINDAPVLMRADVGIAMGAIGSDAAIEAADVVLMDDDPMKIVQAIRISRKCLRIVYENIIFALLVKLVTLLLGAFGIANMWFAIFADVGVLVIAVLNAIRALRVPKTG